MAAGQAGARLIAQRHWDTSTCWLSNSCLIPEFCLSSPSAPQPVHSSWVSPQAAGPAFCPVLVHFLQRRTLTRCRRCVPFMVCRAAARACSRLAARWAAAWCPTPHCTAAALAAAALAAQQTVLGRAPGCCRGLCLRWGDKPCRWLLVHRKHSTTQISMQIWGEFLPERFQEVLKRGAPACHAVQ